jgi:hypothetical protein
VNAQRSVVCPAEVPASSYDDLPDADERPWQSTISEVILFLRRRRLERRYLPEMLARKIEAVPPYSMLQRDRAADEAEMLGDCELWLESLRRELSPHLANDVRVDLERLAQAALLSVRRERPRLSVRISEIQRRTEDEVARSRAIGEQPLTSKSESALTDTKDLTAVGQPLPPSEGWTKKGPLDLTLNTNTRAVERQGKRVEFGANGRAWEVFVRLAERYSARYLVKNLGRDVWNPRGTDVDPDDNQVQRAISHVRTLLCPIGLTVHHTRHLGYVLAERQPPDTKSKKKAKRPPRRLRRS